MAYRVGVRSFAQRLFHFFSSISFFSPVEFGTVLVCVKGWGCLRNGQFSWFGWLWSMQSPDRVHFGTTLDPRTLRVASKNWSCWGDILCVGFFGPGPESGLQVRLSALMASQDARPLNTRRFAREQQLLSEQNLLIASRFVDFLTRLDWLT